MSEKNEPLMYKGHPLRRKDNMLFYGSMGDKYIVVMQIKESKMLEDLSIATSVSIELQLTDPDITFRDRIVKKANKDSLYAAVDVASAWLERALAGRI